MIYWIKKRNGNQNKEYSTDLAAFITLAPTGVCATLVSSGGGRGGESLPLRDLENEANLRQAVNGIGHGRTSSTIFTEVVFRSGQK